MPVDLQWQQSPLLQEVYVHAIRLAQKAAYKVAQDFPQGNPPEPQVYIPNQSTLRIPEPPEEKSVAYYQTGL